jgi:integrase
MRNYSPGPPPEASSCPKYPRPTSSRSAPRISTDWRRHCPIAGNPWCTSSGLRFYEVAGPRVGRLDIAHLQLQVLETAPQVGGERAEPKTAAGRRTVPVPGLIAEILDDHLHRYGLAGKADALVFSAERGGRLHAANWQKRAWIPARRAAGLPTLRFHDLPHSAVPLWVAVGANLLQVSRWLGHSTVQITADVYGHLFPETNDLAIRRLDKALRAALPQPSDATANVEDPHASTRVRQLRRGT